jgi:CheY-like chemotaxis protein
MSMFAKTPISVLVAEDEPVILAGTVMELRTAGFAVISAGDGQDALQRFEEHPEVSALFTDINMPGPRDGLWLANMIFRLRPDVQLVLTSGRDAPLRGQFPAGAHFLPKPYNCAALAALLSPVVAAAPASLFDPAAPRKPAHR